MAALLDNKQSRYTRDQKKRRVSVVSCISRPGCIERVTQLKLLGVFIDSTLSWNAHIDYIVKKAAKRLYFLKVLKRSGLTSDHLLHFYVAVIRPILEYCSPVWNHNLPQYLSDKIESIQKRAIRIIFSVTRGMSYIFALSYAELPSLQQRRQTLAKELFAEICKPTSCLHYLLPRLVIQLY